MLKRLPTTTAKRTLFTLDWINDEGRLRNQLGPLVDSDPEWRAGAVFTRDEAEQMISDHRIP